VHYKIARFLAMASASSTKAVRNRPVSRHSWRRAGCGVLLELIGEHDPAAEIDIWRLTQDRPKQSNSAKDVLRRMG
jgi:hypothetical protein